MKKTTCRISIFDYANNLCETIAILAAKSIGSENKTSLQSLCNVIEGQKILYPASNENITAELIGENTLHIDRKIIDEYKTVLIIEEVEIFELANINDDFENVVLQRNLPVDISDIF